MKTNKWCSILLMGLMLGACSKDVIEPDNGEHTDWETNKVGYINLSVNLPSQVASRSEVLHCSCLRPVTVTRQKPMLRL